jgi:hypothetical protein
VEGIVLGENVNNRHFVGRKFIYELLKSTNILWNYILELVHFDYL